MATWFFSLGDLAISCSLLLKVSANASLTTRLIHADDCATRWRWLLAQCLPTLLKVLRDTRQAMRQRCDCLMWLVPVLAFLNNYISPTFFHHSIGVVKFCWSINCILKLRFIHVIASAFTVILFLAIKIVIYRVRGNGLCGNDLEKRENSLDLIFDDICFVKTIDRK